MERVKQLAVIASCLSEATSEVADAMERYLRGLKSLPYASEQRAKIMIDMVVTLWSELE